MGFFLTYILLPSLFASGPLCKNLFDPNEAETKFIERVEKVLEKPPFEDSIFTSTRLDQTKLNFYQSQQKHLKRLLSDGTISITDVASARPIEVKTPEGKFYDLVVYRKKILLFDKDGTEAPLEVSTKKNIGFLASERPLLLESAERVFLVSQSGLRFHSKSEAINNEILKPFESLIRPLVERGELNQIVLSDAEIAVSALSGSFYVFIPNIKGSDYYVVDPVPKTLLGMASEMNISETGNTFYLSSSEQIQIRQTTGFLPDKIIERSLEPYLANFLPSLTKKIEFFSKTYREGELAVITDAVNFVLTNNLDARDESVRSAFIKALQKQGYGQTKVYTKVLDELAAIQDRWRETEAI